MVVHWPIQWWPQNSRWVSTIVDCWPFPCRSTEWTKTIFKTTRLSINSSMRSAIVDRQMANKAVFDICFSIYRLFIVHRFYVVRETGSKCTHLEMETHRLSLVVVVVSANHHQIQIALTFVCNVSSSIIGVVRHLTHWPCLEWVVVVVVYHRWFLFSDSMIGRRLRRLMLVKC